MTDRPTDPFTRAREAALEIGEDGELLIGGDPLWISAIKGRLLAVLGGLATVIVAGASVWDRVSIVMADSTLTAAEAVSLLNAAGPLVSANADLLLMLTGLVSVVGAAWSKWRERRRGVPVIVIDREDDA
jgi:hypothetical protein